MGYMWKEGSLLASKDVHTLIYRLNFGGGFTQQEYFGAGILVGLCKSTG